MHMHTRQNRKIGRRQIVATCNENDCDRQQNHQSTIQPNTTTTMQAPPEVISHIREASRLLVRELGFLSPTLAGTDFPPSGVHAIIEIGRSQTITAASLSKILNLGRSNISRTVAK